MAANKVQLDLKNKIRRIAVLTYPGVEILDIGGPIEVFSFANMELLRRGLITEPTYIIDVLAEQPGAVPTLSGLQIIATDAYVNVKQDVDTLIVAGGFIPSGHFEGKEIGDPYVFKNPILMDWLRSMSTQVRRLVSICTGAFALAECGLLNDIKATTHWDFCQRLKQDYPAVIVDPNQIFIQQGHIYTSGGITSGIDLALSLLEEDWGHEIALFVARFMVMFLKRPGGQSQFSNYLTVEAANRHDLRELQNWIMENLAKDLRVEKLAEKMCMSPRNFARLFVSETGMTPAKYVEMARIDAARFYLESCHLSIQTIAEKVGFLDPERMRKTFIRHIGVTPQNYRSRFKSDFLNKTRISVERD